LLHHPLDLHLYGLPFSPGKAPPYKHRAYIVVQYGTYPGTRRSEVKQKHQYSPTAYSHCPYTYSG